MVTHAQAFNDHEYLWTMYGPANDMTGGYVDQEDLAKLLRNPTKAVAKACLENQIIYWFTVGPDTGGNDTRASIKIALDSDYKVREIAERYGIMEFNE